MVLPCLGRRADLEVGVLREIQASSHLGGIIVVVEVVENT